MSDNTHGGPRPKSRPDDHRGGAGRGQGRKKSVHKVKVGETLIAEVSKDGEPLVPPLPFDVASMGNGVILLQCDEYQIALHI